MKKILFSISVILFFLATLCSPKSFAQDAALLGLPEGTKVRLLSKTEVISDIAHLSDGMRLAVPTRMGVWIYDVQTGEALDLIRGPVYGSWNKVSFSPDGQTLAIASGEDDFTLRQTIWTVRLWDARTGELRHTLMEDEPQHPRILLFSPNGQTLAIVSNKIGRTFVRNGISYAVYIYALRLWDVQTGKLRRTLVEDNNDIKDISFSSNGSTLIAGRYSSLEPSRPSFLELWDVHTGKLLDSKPTPDGPKEDFQIIRSLSPNGQMGAEYKRGPRILVWDLSRLWDGPETKPIHNSTLIGHTHQFIDDILFSSDGQTVASSDQDGTIILWNTLTGTAIRFTGYERLHDSISLSPDGQNLAHSSKNSGTIRFWDATGKHLHTLTGHTSWFGPSFSPDGQTLAAYSGNQIGLWNARTGERLHTLTEDTEQFRSISLSPDGQTLATAGYMYRNRDYIYTLRLWDVRTGKRLHTLAERSERFYDTSLSYNGHILAVGYTDGTIRLWDVHTGRSLRSFAGYRHWFDSVPLSPDGQTLATIDRDEKKIHLWDVRTGKRRHTLKGHTDRVLQNIVFSPNGDTIASSSRDNTHPSVGCTHRQTPPHDQAVFPEDVVQS